MPENCALSGVFQTGHLLDGLHGEGQGTTHSHTGHQAGVVVGKEAAGHIAGDVQALHGLVVGVQSLTLFVDGDALLSGQQGSTQPAAVEGRGANGAQAVSGLAEVLIVLLIVQLIVARKVSLAAPVKPILSASSSSVSHLNSAPASIASSILP